MITFFQQSARNYKKILQLCQNIGEKNQFLFERFQLTSMYFLAILVLTHSVKESTDLFPEILVRMFPFIPNLLQIRSFNLVVSPEKTLFYYMLFLEFIIKRSYFNFSRLVKFNLLLIFLLEMFQNIITSCWDILFNGQLGYGDAVGESTVKTVFYAALFTVYVLLYSYAYLCSINGLLPTLPGVLNGLIESVAFWVKSRDPERRK